MRASDLTSIADGLVLAVPADPQPPAQYSWWVWGLALLLIALVAAWYWWVVWSTRARTVQARRSRTDVYAAIRTEQLAAVDAAYGRYTSGESDLRTLHLDLNHTIRQFATQRAGIDVSSLTVRELGRLEHGGAIQELLEDYQEPAFAAASDNHAEHAADQAREVIRTW
ncbi:hypothetical protein [Litorihabitans aurantiacus]|uniref:DUF4381 domain-containing protein n=1 Tax=Litorihabitans aurantiacus TaxID=1930061 RepID=A0AA37XGB8_9MICO|nr:hypothetical protein [Litorihabitans aurantiacus]GMA32790.1 hypothetical protein GCM10025875_27820 [Litorihabitans aurantiacus]